MWISWALQIASDDGFIAASAATSRFMPSSLLHDVEVRAAGLNADFELESSLWKLMDTFGRKEARFLPPYWKNSDMVKAEPVGCYASLYQRPQNGVLAIVSNLGKDEATVRLTFGPQKLGLPGEGLEVSDGLTGER